MVFRFAGFELDQQRAELRGSDGAPVKLRPKTFQMLRLFVDNAGLVLSKQQLMEAVWPNVHVGEDSLFQCIREIRTALGDDRRQMIKLASGGGYIFTLDVTAAPAGPAAPEAFQAADPGATAPVEAMAEPPSRQGFLFGLRGRAAAAAVVGLCAVIGLAVAAPVFGPGLIFKRAPPIVAVMPIVDASNDPRGAAMAGEVTGLLTEGLARISNIRVVAPRPAAGAEQTSAPPMPSEFEVRGELQRSEQSWILRERMIRTATGEVQSVATVSVDSDMPDTQLQQARLAAGVGHPLARRLNEILEAGSSATRGASTGGTKVVIEQALASIHQTTRERFGMAQTMLKKALADEPDNVDIAVALASLQLRGIQMVWFSPDEATAVEAQTSATLERALRVKPNSIAVLETSCRFLSATNHFVESLVTCARMLSFDPWNGGALYLVGLGQLNLGRFEDALATFQQADRFDTPSVSRWTWLLGIGWAYVVLDRSEDALPWLQRSIAITPATGRSNMLLAAALQKSGRIDEAKAAMQAGLKLRPGTTALNISPPTRNSSPVFVAATQGIIRAMVEAGLPER
ncbi:CadC family transcriptional regulator [Rhodoplanes sp. Z2-YC6860]|nr:CadC family transcriptional regulator [Rhodoplanes sp. Z2-YC6860]